MLIKVALMQDIVSEFIYAMSILATRIVTKATNQSVVFLAILIVWQYH